MSKDDKKATGFLKHSQPTRNEAEQAVKTLIAWAGDDPKRAALLKTPARVVAAYEEFFCGYRLDPEAILASAYPNTEGYDEIILLKGMRLESHCEHHLVSMVGTAHVAYIPNDHYVGISKLARVVDAYAKRLQVQERLTMQIAHCIKHTLQPKGVAVVINAAHECMTTRGVHKAYTNTITSCLLGVFREDPKTRSEFMTLIA